MKINKILLVIMCVVICFVSSFSISTTVSAATEKSDGQNMKKVLYYYGKKNYKAAKKYNKKISKTAHEACVSKMTEKMKKAYKKIYTKYLKSGEFLSYYLTDVDNDGKAELLIETTGDEVTKKLVCYTYKNNKTKKVGSLTGGWVKLCAYPKHGGIIRMKTVMGPPGGYGESMYLISIKNGKLRESKIGGRLVMYHKDKGLELRNELKARHTM